MAEIRLKKRKKKVWPWMMVMLIVAAIAWLVVEVSELKFDRTAIGASVEEWKEKWGMQKGSMDEDASSKDKEKGIDEFIAFVNDSAFMYDALDEEKVKEGLRYLSDALNEVISEKKIDNEAILADRKALIEQLNAEVSEDNPMALQPGPGDIQRSFFTAANLILLIQQAGFPELAAEAEDVQRSAANIHPEMDLYAQNQYVKDFFMKTGYALQSIRETLYGELA